jgi:cytochrome c553
LDHVPNLAGQHAFYLLTQIDKFGDGRRKDEFMSGLVKVLKPEDRSNIAVLYATQEVVYLMNAMRDYRAGRGLRADLRMTSVAKGLSDARSRPWPVTWPA